jgi:Winged helix-turn helix
MASTARRSTNGSRRQLSWATGALHAKPVTGASPGATSVSLGERQRSAPVWLGPWLVDTIRCGGADITEVLRLACAEAVGELLAKLGLTPQKPLQRAYQRDPEAIEKRRREIFPSIVGKAKAAESDVYFWDGSGFRADSMHGKTWGDRWRHEE